MSELVSALRLAVVASLPSAGTQGRALVLSTNGHLYVDDGVAWTDCGAAPGGIPGNIQFNSGGNFGGAASVGVLDGELFLGNQASVAIPTSGLKVSARSLASHQMMWLVNGYDSNFSRMLSSPRPVAFHTGFTRVGSWMPPGNATTVPLADGIAAPTATGTATARTVAVTNLLTQTRRLGYVSAATAAALCGYRTGAAQFWRGNAAGLGGFFFVHRFAPSDAAAVSGARMFVGLQATTGAPTNIEPNTMINSIGVCQPSTSNNVHLLNNDGTGTATTVDLGANFPASGNTALYQLTLWCPPNESFIGYHFERLDTGDVSEGTWTTDIPANNTLLGIQAWRTNNATALAVALDLCSLTIETDF